MNTYLNIFFILLVICIIFILLYKKYEHFQGDSTIPSILSLFQDDNELKGLFTENINNSLYNTRENKEDTLKRLKTHILNLKQSLNMINYIDNDKPECREIDLVPENQRPDCTAITELNECDNNEHCEKINYSFNDGQEWLVNVLPNKCKQKEYNNKCLNRHGNPLNHDKIRSI